MKCSELMKIPVEVCAISDPVGLIAERMRVKNIGFMPVCGPDGAVIGILTDRDLAVRVLGGQRDPQSTTAGDVLTPDVVSCSPEDDLRLVEELMSKHKISRIVCLDAAKRPAGIISLSDVAMTERRGLASAVLRSVSQREAGNSSIPRS
jgi:predicted transcriptional regulator